MKLSTKIVLGYALIILLMVTALLYELSLVHTMHRINRELSLMKTRATHYLLNAHDIDQVEEFTRKLFVTGDPGYLDQLRENRGLLSEDLAGIDRTQLSGTERAELEKLTALWADYSNSAAAIEARLADTPREELDKWLSTHMSRLRAQLDRIVEANQAAIDAEVRQSANAGQKAEFVSRVAAFVTVALSFLVSFVIVRSISHSLANLTHGARAVAQGEFSYRLDASGNDHFSRVARDFNFMASRLNELDQLKRDYVSHVSHELKAPLAAIQETARIILHEIPGPLNEKQKRLLTLALQAGDRLRRTIIGLLDISRMEAGAFDYAMQRSDIRTVVQDALKEFEVQFAEKGRPLYLHLPVDPLWVDCDSDRVGQILSNLIDNACKFSPEKAPIEVTVQAVSEAPAATSTLLASTASAANGYALVRVVDRGTGVPVNHKQLIFEKYHQVKAGKKLAGQGVGLGLVICRNIALAHSGTIWVEDNPAGGSVFCLLIPLSGPEAPKPSVPVDQTATAGPASRA